ncbi:MAG: hypothetical protein QQN41_10720 [Nitrosopumilus sp.]
MQNNIQIDQICNQLNKESERGSAIVSAILLEGALEYNLKAFMADSIGRKDELFDSAFAPLGTLSAKITMALRLGLISPVIFKTFHLIRKIRNEFAHVADSISFGTDSIHDKIQEIFEMHQSLLDTAWDIAQKYTDLTEKDSNINNGLENLVHNIGWRGTYEIIVSVFIAGLNDKIRTIPKIKPVYRD